VLDTTQVTESGLVNGDRVTELTLASAGTGATSSAGSYNINASNATGTGLTNYVIN
jgi:hypothetical protein